jgi:phage terminase small subunit
MASSMTLPKPPADLDASSRKVWTTALAELEDAGTWTEAAAPLLELYVRALQTARQARGRISKRLKQDGEEAAFFAKGSMGQLVAHPDIGIARSAEQDAARLAAALLIEPAARRRARLDQDDLEGLFR